MSREPFAASVLVMLMVRSPRASGGRRRSDDLVPGLPDDLSSGRPAPRDADSWSFLPLVLRQRGATVAPRTGMTAWLPPLFPRGGGAWWVGAAVAPGTPRDDGAGARRHPPRRQRACP